MSLWDTAKAETTSKDAQDAEKRLIASRSPSSLRPAVAGLRLARKKKTRRNSTRRPSASARLAASNQLVAVQIVSRSSGQGSRDVVVSLIVEGRLTEPWLQEIEGGNHSFRSPRLATIHSAPHSKTMIATDTPGRSNQRRCNCARDAIFFLLPARASAWPRFRRRRSHRC